MLQRFLLGLIQGSFYFFVSSKFVVAISKVGDAFSSSLINYKGNVK
jgi:hypothetical protein